MSKEAVFTLKLEPELRADLMAAVASEDRPAFQVVRELMRSKVAASRASMRAGRGRTNDAVEAQFSAKRQQLADPA